MNSRREFLQKITASAIALPLTQYFQPAGGKTGPDSDENRQVSDDPVLRVAIMGLGSYGTRVAEAMQSCTNAKLVGVISGTPSKITAWQSKYNIPEKNCYNYENCDAIKDLSLIHISEPTRLLSISYAV